MHDKYSIREGQIYRNLKGLQRRVIRKDYIIGIGTPNTYIVTYVKIGDGGKTYSCDIKTFVRWVNN